MRLILLLFCLTCVLLLTAGNATARTYTHDKPMNVAVINGIDIGYVVAGEVDAPAVVLIMGLTASHRLWDEAFINGLVEQGYRVVLFDNRDTGSSARLDELGEPTLWWEMIKNMIGFDVDAPYTLGDMAKDTVGVMNELGIESAHVVGASMGGMIAQIVAAEYPERVRSLVSIMSTTGAPHLPEADEEASQGLQEIGASDGDAAGALNAMGVFPSAMPRQLLAIVAAGDRSDQVRTIAVPTLVLHGEDDTLLPPAHGAHTHELINGSRYVVYPGMGHNMPEPVIPNIVADMVDHFRQVEGAGAES